MGEESGSEDPVLEVEAGGVIINQDLSVMTMRNVNWASGEIEDVNFHCGKIKNSNLRGITITDCDLNENSTIDGVPLLEAITLWRAHKGVI